MEKLVRKLAHQSRIDIPDNELNWFADQIGTKIGYLSVLDEISFNPQKRQVMSPKLREDESAPSLCRETLFNNTPNHDGSYFILPVNSGD